MKFTSRSFLLAAVVLLSLVSIAAAPLASRNPFAGVWKGTDIGDGSQITVSIAGGVSKQNVYQVNYVDKYVAACGGIAKATGRGTVVGGVLTTTMALKCKSTGAVINPSFNIGMVKSPTPGTLTDASGTTYSIARYASCNGR